MTPRRRLAGAALLLASRLPRVAGVVRASWGRGVAATAALAAEQARAQTAPQPGAQSAAQSAAQGPPRPAPSYAFGPHSPVSWAGEVDADLIEFQGRAYSGGTPMLLSGQVLSVQGRPIESAQVEIWQTDANGKYRHPGDDGEGPAQRGFQGYGRMRSDANGQYRFRTIKPVIYGGRPPHVHFKVEAPGHRTLVTQLYFEGENQERGFFGGFSRERDRLTIRTGRAQDQGREVLTARFDLVLAAA